MHIHTQTFFTTEANMSTANDKVYDGITYYMLYMTL